MTETEKQLRIKLAAAHHVVHYNGWDDLLAAHLSARIPNTEQLLLTPMNVPFEKVSASALIKCDFSGKVVDDNGQKLMPQAINIHGALYPQNNALMSAMHTHSLCGESVSALECGLLFMTQQSLRFYNDVAYHHYDGLALENEGEQIVKSLQDKRVMILHNHGLLTTGRSIEEALYLLYYLELACKTQINIMSTQAPRVNIPDAVCQKTKAQFDSILRPDMEFAALVERIEGLSSVDYRN